jgi:hypothetical protein
MRALKEEGPRGPLNIALTGHYGTGKSSILSELEARLGEAAVNVSLSSLGADEAFVRTGHDESESGSPRVTNVIQKEIVKQLLYRQDPHTMRGSRYRRIEPFQPVRAVGWATLLTLLVSVVAAVAGWTAKLDGAIPLAQPWGHFAIKLALAGLVGAACYQIQASVHGKVWLEKFSAGPATVTLANQENFYFDEYLDEIVYVFQRAKYNVVVFEDIDRFGNTLIFETLRELNTLLNNAQQLSQRPIRFVFALRDSVFSVLAGPQGEADPQEAATNRTKFFDLVIPVVPFITHRTSRDLITTQMDGCQPPVSGDVIAVVARHLSDMRLVKNIRNEYDVFSRKILTPHGIRGLAPDNLFALIVYKNVHLEGFEKITVGESSLDDLYEASRIAVSQNVAACDREISAIKSKIARITAASAAAERLGTRLTELIPAMVRLRTNLAVEAEVQVAGERFDDAQLGTVEFWQTVLDNDANITLAIPQRGSFDVSRRTLEILLDEELDAEAWASSQIADLNNRVAALEARRSAIKTLPFTGLIADADITVDPGDGARTFRTAAAEALKSDLAYDLVQAGFLDQNFALYAAQYHGINVSASAMNFIIHAFERGVPDPQYRFESAAEVEQVAAETASGIFTSPSVYNVDIFNHYMDADPTRLQWGVDQMRAGAADARSFLHDYLAGGERPEVLAQLLAPVWTDLFTTLAELPDLTPDRRSRLLDAALTRADPAIPYSTSPALRALLEESYPDLPIFAGQITPEASDSLAAVAGALGFIAPRLAPLGSSRESFITASSYAFTAENLIVAAGEAGLELDALKTARKAVYENAIRNLPRYVAALEETGFTRTVSRPSEFPAIFDDVARHNSDSELLQNIATNAAPGSVVTELTDVTPAAWPALLATDHVVNTASNVAAYIAENPQNGVDEVLAGFLTRAGELTGADRVVDLAAGLAATIANSSGLTTPVKVQLIKSLKLPEPLEASAVAPRDDELYARLIQAGALLDDEAAWVRLDGLPAASRHVAAASKALPKYLSELVLDADDIAAIAEEGSAAAKDALLSEIAEYEDVAARRSLTKLAAWARQEGRMVDADVLAVFARRNVEAGVVIALLSANLPNTASPALQAVLEGLGGRYAQLVAADGKRPAMPKDVAHTRLLQRLVTDGAVKSFRTDRRHSDEYRVVT